MMTDDSAGGGSGFDLRHEPWILVLRLDGSQDELSIIEVFEQAHELQAIVGEVPTQMFALARLLLAILMCGIGGPADDEEWAELWRAQALPAQQIRLYLNEYADRFDLLHPETPFYQVAELHTPSGKFSSLRKLIIDVPDNDLLFTTRLGSGLSRISAAEAARWVVHCQGYDSPGTKTGAAGDPAAERGQGFAQKCWLGQIGGVLLEGRNVKETLLLNLLPAEGWSRLNTSDDDCPAWERTPQTATPAHGKDNQGLPRGLLDLYTWQGRRIRLIHDGSGVCDALICNGDQLDSDNMHLHEPMTAWRFRGRRQSGYRPNLHNADESIWRDLRALLPEFASQVNSRQGVTGIPPLTIEWVEWLRESRPGLLEDDLLLLVRAVGVEYGIRKANGRRDNQGRVNDIVSDRLILPMELLGEGARELRNLVMDALTAVDCSVDRLAELSRELVLACVSRSGSENLLRGREDQAREEGYAALDSVFRRWVSALERRTDGVAVSRQLQTEVKGVMEGLANEYVGNAGPTAWIGRHDDKDHHHSSPEADLRFRRNLRKVLPLAYERRGEAV